MAVFCYNHVRTKSMGAKMSYPQRGKRELAALSALESSINRLASKFQGRSSRRFSHESELTAHLVEGEGDKFYLMENI